MNRLEEAEKAVMKGSLVSITAKTGSVIMDTVIRYRFNPRGPIGAYEAKEITREEAIQILEGDN